MRSSALVALVALAVAAPACAAPFNPVFARDAPAAADASDDSGAISLKTVGTIGSIAAPLVGGIIDHFTGDQQQRRDSPMDSFQQAMQAQAQGASQQTAAQMAQEQEQMLNAQRGSNQKTAARADEGEDSGAISLKTIGTIGSVAAPLVGGIIDHFTGGDQQQRREILSLLAREAVDDDESGAVSLKTLGSIGSIAASAAPLVGDVVNHFTGDQQQRRELLSLLAREAVDDDESGAVSLKTLGSIGSIAASAGSLVGDVVNHFTGDQQQRRDTQAGDDDSGAISLKTIGTIGSVAAPLVGGIIDHFTGGDQQQKREILSLLARSAVDDDESGAVSLKTLGNIGSVAATAAPLVGGIVDHFTGDQQQQRREAQDSDDDSGAISLKTVGTIGSIAAPLVGGIIDHFTGDQQRRGDPDVGSTYNPIHGSNGPWRIAPPRPTVEQRDLLSLLARAVADDSESGAIFQAPGSFGPTGPTGPLEVPYTGGGLW